MIFVPFPVARIVDVKSPIPSTESTALSLNGEIWNAESIDDEIKRGEEIIVTKIINLKLFVKRKDKN